jgi:hypothetical protein
MPRRPNPPPVPPAIEELISLGIEDTAARTGISRAGIYRLLRAGRLQSFTLGTRRFIDGASLRALIAEAKATSEHTWHRSRRRDGRWTDGPKDGSENYLAKKRQRI